MIRKEDHAKLVDAQRGLPPAPARLFIALWSSRGRVVLYDALEQAMFDATASRAHKLSLQSTKKVLMRYARNAGWPISVKAETDLGYRLELHDKNWNPFKGDDNAD